MTDKEITIQVGRANGKGVTCFEALYKAVTLLKELQNENKKYKEMVEDMKADMCGTESKELFAYLEGILIKYGEVIK